MLRPLRPVRGLAIIWEDCYLYYYRGKNKGK